MRAIWNHLNETSQSWLSAGITALICASLGLGSVAAGQAVPKVVLSQSTQLTTLPGGGVISSGNYAGSEIAVNQQGNVFLGEPNGGDVLMINGTTGARSTVISGWGNPAAVLVDSANNLYIASLYSTQVEVLKIPYVSGAYVTATAPTATTPGCTGSDTAECYVANLTNGNDGYYFQTRSMTFDAAGNFYFAYGTSTGSNIFECTASCLTTGSPQASLIYADTGGPGTNGATYGIGGMTVDSAGNLFFADSAYKVDSSYNPTSYQSNLKELVYTAGTGFAATPVTLYTMTPSSPGAYDDEITTAVWANGVLYWGTVLDGIYAYTDAAGVVNVADPYTVSTQGVKAMTTDGNGNFWLDTYNNGDVFVKVTTSISLPQATVGGTPSTAGFVVSLNDGSCVSTGVTFTSSDPEFSAATSGACSAGFLTNSSSFAATATFTPTSGGVKTTTLTATDSQNATGTATATGTGIGVALPVISLPSGSYNGVQSVMITDATPGSTIYYTIDGSTPTTSSTVYAGAISVGTSETISAFATAPSLANSPVVSATYTITLSPAATPTFLPLGGNYTSAQTVTISSTTVGASIYYTTNGTTPTTSSALYSTPITVSLSETVQAIATAPGYLTSAVGSAVYVITPAVVNTTKVIFNQTNGYIGALSGGGAISGGNPAGTSMAVNQQGTLLAGNTYGGKIFAFNGPTNTAVTLGSFSNVGPIAVDGANNLIVGNTYSGTIAKIPYVAGSYVAFTGTSGSTPNCTGADTVECVLPITEPGVSGAVSLAFDTAGNLYIGSTNSGSGSNGIYKVAAGSLYTGTGTATLIYQEPSTSAATQLNVGAIAADQYGDIFFTDAVFDPTGQNKSTSSNVKELVYTSGTGYALTPTVIYAYVNSSPGNYDDYVDGVAVDAKGTVYMAGQYDGVYAFPNAAGVVNTAGMYTVTTQGTKAMALDAKDGGVYSVTYNGGAGGDVAVYTAVNNLVVPSATVGGTATTATNVTVILNDGSCTVPESVAFAATENGVVSTEFSAVTTGNCSSVGLGSGSQFPVTVTFAPTTDGVRTGVLTATDSDTNSGSATVIGVANGSDPQAATPAFSIPGGNYTTAQTVTITDTTPGVTIYYTLDGTTPTASSTPYTAAITVSATETIKAIAIATTNFSPSAVATAAYTIGPASVVGATNVIFNQTNGYVGALTGGGTVSSLNPTGTTVAVNQQGNLIAGNSYGGKVLLFNGPAGTSTTLGSFGNVGPELVDSANNLWIAEIGGTPIAKIPYAAGTYAVASVNGSTPLCTGVDTVECVLPFSTSPAFTAAISGVVGLAMDPTGNLFYTTMGANPYSGPPSAPVYNAVYECNVACLYSATATPTLIYQETVQSTAANQYVVGAIAVDKWDDVFFIDSRFQPNMSNASSVSNLQELVYTTLTGYAATPTTLYTYTNASPGSYDDYLMGLATDANGTVYLSGQYDGVYGFPNNHGVVNTAGMYAVTTQGAKAIALDSLGDVYELTYNGGAGGDVAVFTAVNNLTVPTATVGGAPTTATDVTVIINDAAASSNPTVMIASSDSEFSAVTTGTASGVGLSTGAQYAATITFTPTTSGTRTSTLTGTDSDSNTGTATVTGLAKATVLTPQTIMFTPPTSPVTYGVGPITLVATASSGLPVSFTVTSGPGSVSGSTLTVTGAGSIVVTATQAGNTLYLAAPPVAQTIVVNAEGQTIMFPAPTTPVVFGVAPITLTATASSGLAVSYSVTSGPGSVSGSTLTVTGAGTIVVAAAQAGNTNYSAATSVSHSIVVTQGTATVAITPIAAVAPGSTSSTVTGTVTGVTGGALPGAGGTSTVTCNYYNSASTLVGSTTGTVTAGTTNSSFSCGIPSVVTGTGGSYTVNVFFNGDTNYLATAGNGANFNVLLTQTINFTAASPVNYGVAPITLSATATSGLPVTFAVTSGPGSITGSTLTVTGVGTIVVSATQAGNGTYAAATAVSQNIVVNQEAQTINFTVASPVTYGVAPITLSASSTSGLPVSFAVTSGPGTISGSTLTVTNYGTIVISATQAGNTNIAAATAVSQSLVVNALGTVATPTFSIAGGTYNAIQTVTIADTTVGSTIYYTVTTGGSTGAATVYTGPVTVGSTETLSAYAQETGYVTSGTATATYTLPVTFTLSEDQNALQVTYGYSGYVNVTVTPEFGFSAPVTFACSGLPTGATCSFSPASVTPIAGAPVTTQVNVSVPAVSAHVDSRGVNPLIPGGASLAAALCCFGLRKRKRIAAVLMVLVGLVGMGMLSGCGSTTQATPPIVTKNVTVTATSGSVVQTITFALTEQ